MKVVYAQLQAGVDGTQALRDGFHADMHPGNLFVDEPGRLVAVDFGIMGRLDAGMRRFMAGTLAGFLAARLPPGGANCIMNLPLCRRIIDRDFCPGACAPSASRFSAKAPAMFPSPGCWGNCSKPRAASTCRPSRSWCCCKRPWWWWKAWRAASIPISTSGRRRVRWPSNG